MKKILGLIIMALMIGLSSFALEMQDKHYELTQSDDKIIAMTFSGEFFEHEEGKDFKYIGRLKKADSMSFCFVWQGRIYVFDYEEGEFKRALLDGETGKEEKLSFMKKVIDTRNYHLKSLKVYNNKLYFIYEHENSRKGKLCRYDLEAKQLKSIKFNGVAEYFINADDSVILTVSNNIDEPKKASTVFSVADFEKGKLKKLCKMNGWLVCPNEAGGKLYAVDKRLGSFLEFDMSGKLIRSQNNPNSLSAKLGICKDGKYGVMNSMGEYFPDLDEKLGKTKLKVYGFPIWEREERFMQLHPDITLVDVGENININFAEAFVTGQLDFDVAEVNIDNKQIQRLFEKGYFLDLTQDSRIKEKADKLYESIKKAVFLDGKLCCFPNRVQFENMFYMTDEFRKEIGISKEEMPETTEELLDLLIKLQEKLKANGEGYMKCLGESPKYDVFQYVQEAYVENYDFNNKPLDFDTEEYRRLMGKVQKLVSLVPSQQAMSGAVLFPRDFNVLNYDVENLFRIPLKKGEAPKYRLWFSAYIINPKSKNIQAALDFVNHQISYNSNEFQQRDKVFLFNEKHEPIKNPLFESNMASLKEKIELLEKSILNEKRAVRKREMEEDLKRMKENFENIEEHEKYFLSQSKIDFYQKKFIDHVFISPRHESIFTNSRLEKYIKNFLNNSIKVDAFVNEISNMEKIKQLENRK